MSIWNSNEFVLLITFYSSLGFAFFIFSTAAWHGLYSYDSQIGVQKYHGHSTTRIGGLGIVLSVLLAYVFTPFQVQELLGPLILAAIPAFSVGFAEDVTRKIGVRTRLLFTLLAGVLAWSLTDTSILRLDLPGIDLLLGFALVSVLFTAFALSGMANAVNMIDGFNGLAVGTVLICLGAMAVLSASLGDFALTTAAMILAAAALGFAVLNWPFGKLFMGDGGAYFLGFGMGWIGVLLHARHPEVSPWAVLTICAYPVVEVAYTIFRRVRRKNHATLPDRLHLHSLVYRRLIRPHFPNTPRLLQNSLTGAIMWFAALLPATLALQLPTHTGYLILSFIGCTLLYTAFYARLTQFHWCIRAKRHPVAIATYESRF
jgi:UDP-N-acetylmuramyl pentapeptide phosphotransferase/UDP-N-acetylglucosamine-1-phosphate transferase